MKKKVDGYHWYNQHIVYFHLIERYFQVYGIGHHCFHCWKLIVIKLDGML